jgi:glycosyltransferase involved in cell wall biosynthesis
MTEPHAAAPPGSSRVLVITENLGGGTGNHLLAMTRLWRRQGWEAEILSHAPLLAREAPGIPIHVVPRRRFDRYPLTQVRRCAIAWRHVTRFQPSVVHTYFFWSILYGRILKALGKVKHLIENREDQGFSWGARDYSILRATRALPDRVICVSDAVRRVVLEREHLDPSRVTVIRNGVEIPPDRPVDLNAIREEVGLRPEHLVVGMVANFNRPVKGVRYLIEAAPAVVRAVPHVRFLLLGTGNQETELRELTARLGMTRHVVFAGHRYNIDEYYALMDVSVLTSLSEGLSITLLESMSHGLPVVVTSVGGNPEVVVEGVTGYLVAPRDTAAFADKVIRLLTDPARRASFGQAARRMVQRDFDLNLVAERYLQEYAHVLSGEMRSSGN